MPVRASIWPNRCRAICSMTATWKRTATCRRKIKCEKKPAPRSNGPAFHQTPGQALALDGRVADGAACIRDCAGHPFVSRYRRRRRRSARVARFVKLAACGTLGVLKPRVPDVVATHQIDDALGHVLGVVAD